MIQNKTWFTLVELLISIFMTAILMLIIASLYPNLIQTFSKQKAMLDFQQSFVLDNFYLSDILKQSVYTFTQHSTETYERRNSKLMLLNGKENFPYSFIYKWDDIWNINATSDTKMFIKNTFLYSDFVEVGNKIYFTNPWEHTIYEYDTVTQNIQLKYGTLNTFWYDNTWIWLFHTPSWITSDGTNLYISDTWNNCIRRIVLSTGTIDTFAWIPETSWYNVWENNISGTLKWEALFDSPTGITFKSGYLYVADTFNNRIRQISAQYVYTLVGSEHIWKNTDIWNATDVYVNYPLALEEYQNWLIFSDALNGKIRYLYFDSQWRIQTLVGIDTVTSQDISHISKYYKNYYISSLQSQWNDFYFNDTEQWTIYKYTLSWSVWWDDDVITSFLWKTDKNILSNGDFENDITTVSQINDMIISNIEMYNIIQVNHLYPFSWDKYLNINTQGTTAKGNITFTSNVAQGDILQIWNRVFEFVTDVSQATLWNIAIPLGGTLYDTLQSLRNEFMNYGIISTLSWNILEVSHENIGSIWNTLAFSGTLQWATFSPVDGTLDGWEEYNSTSWDQWYFSFQFQKNLEPWQKYKLRFYIAGAQDYFSLDETQPIIRIDTWNNIWSDQESILNIYKNFWNEHELIFTASGWLQTFKIETLYGKNIFIDAMTLQPVGNIRDLNTQTFQDFQIGKLPTFYIYGTSVFLGDILENKLWILEVWNYTLSSIVYKMFDIESFEMNFKSDYIGNSMLDFFTFLLNENHIVYSLGQDDFILKISNNFK